MISNPPGKNSQSMQLHFIKITISVGSRMIAQLIHLWSTDRNCMDHKYRSCRLFYLPNSMLKHKYGKDTNVSLLCACNRKHGLVCSFVSLSLLTCAQPARCSGKKNRKYVLTRNLAGSFLNCIVEGPPRR